MDLALKVAMLGDGAFWTENIVDEHFPGRPENRETPK
jgi:hypothetical protein